MIGRVFVYGLLREGESLGHILQGLPRSGPHTLDGFALYHLGRYPGAVHGPGTLVGELFEIPHDAILAALDEAEGAFADPPLYVRERVTLRGGDVGEVNAWIYVYDRPVNDAPRIATGDWLNR